MPTEAIAVDYDYYDHDDDDCLDSSHEGSASSISETNTHDDVNMDSKQTVSSDDHRVHSGRGLIVRKDVVLNPDFPTLNSVSGVVGEDYNVSEVNEVVRGDSHSRSAFPVFCDQGKDRKRRLSESDQLRADFKICEESINIISFLHKAAFFLARGRQKNIDLAKSWDVWTTSPKNEDLLHEALRKSFVVILVFLATGSNHFSGFARICSRAKYRQQRALPWADYVGGGIIKIKWISKLSLPIKKTEHIKNPFNRERAIFAGLDGSEIQRNAGKQLCYMFPFDKTVDLDEVRKLTPDSFCESKCIVPDNTVNRESIPSLFDKPISYNQFARAQRTTFYEQVLTERYSAWNPGMCCDNMYIGHSTMVQPMPLMDIRFDSYANNSAQNALDWHRRLEARPSRHISRSLLRRRSRSRSKRSSVLVSKSPRDFPKHRHYEGKAREKCFRRERSKSSERSCDSRRRNHDSDYSRQGDRTISVSSSSRYARDKRSSSRHRYAGSSRR